MAQVMRVMGNYQDDIIMIYSLGSLAWGGPRRLQGRLFALRVLVDGVTPSVEVCCKDRLLAMINVCCRNNKKNELF